MFRLADKELQRKSLEDSLNAERSSGASRETKMQVQSTARWLYLLGLYRINVVILLYYSFSRFPLQALHNENLSLKADVQNLQAQISEQVSERFFKSYMRHYWLLFDTPVSLFLYLLLIVPLQAASQLTLDQFQKRCVWTATSLKKMWCILRA